MSRPIELFLDSEQAHDDEMAAMVERVRVMHQRPDSVARHSEGAQGLWSQSVEALAPQQAPVEHEGGQDSSRSNG